MNKEVFKKKFLLVLILLVSILLYYIYGVKTGEPGGLFVNDTIIRPYIGDVLVIILMYVLIRGIVQKSIKFLPVYLFFFASTVEMAQYYRIVDILNLQDNKVISTIIGTSFDIKDILCYLVATVILIIWEKMEKTRYSR